MAYGLKYRITFKTLQGDTCKVDLFIDGYTGGITNLDPASNPFVLQEFNSDEDIYKPLRPQQATITPNSTNRYLKTNQISLLNRAQKTAQKLPTYSTQFL